MKERVTANRSEIRSLLASNGTKFIGVTFVKKGDGNVRIMNANPSPAPKENSKGLGYNPEAKGMKLMFDMKIRTARKNAMRNGVEHKDEGYRMVTFDRITELRMGGKVYTVVG